MTTRHSSRGGNTARHALRSPRPPDPSLRPSPTHQRERPRACARGRVFCPAGGYWCGKAECPECGPAKREPNCRWATSREQINNRGVSVVLEYGGERLPLTVWAERLGCSVNTLRVRLEKGWSAEETIGTPIRAYRKKM